MREDICTLPVVDIFKEKCGCPICNMEFMLEERITDYILGAAMMEPDIRIKTNEEGFCKNHILKMYQKNAKLQLSLMLSTYINELKTNLLKNPKKAAETLNGCFICNRIKKGKENMINTLLINFENSSEFRKLAEDSEYFCPKHALELYNKAGKKYMKHYYKDFQKMDIEKAQSKLNSVYKNLLGFSKLYDYNFKNDKTLKENYEEGLLKSVEFLTGKK